MSKNKSIVVYPLISHELIERKIFLMRGKKVMLDHDLASLYQVETKALNQAVKRNSRRFPPDFMFQLSPSEKKEVVTNCDHLKILKFSPSLPYAFTELGIAMLSGVLNSSRAIQANVQIMRTFIRLRELLATNELLRQKMEELERKYEKHDTQFKVIFEALREILETPKPKPKKSIGFHVKY